MILLRCRRQERKQRDILPRRSRHLDTALGCGPQRRYIDLVLATHCTSTTWRATRRENGAIVRIRAIAVLIRWPSNEREHPQERTASDLQRLRPLKEAG